MKLFLSHASEDKVNLVGPLVESLREHFEVWYDRYVLTIGDSLLQRISEGLRECDYGIVVLSKAFFSKKWPRAELDGLFALETKERKVILPIWHEVTEEDVKAFSPILSGRLAVTSDRGISSIVHEIRTAIGAAERKGSFSGLDAARQKWVNLDDSVSTQQSSNRLLRTREGAQLVANSAFSIMEENIRLFQHLNDSGTSLKFSITPRRFLGGDETMSVEGPFRLSLRIAYRNLSRESADDALLQVDHYHLGLSDYGVSRQAHRLGTEKFSPHFDRNGQVCWKSSKRDLTTQQLLEVLVLDFVDLIDSKKPKPQT